jgi:membrane protein
VLKAVSFLVLGSAQGSPAFQAFGVALVLVVWMNYTSRVTLYGAAYAHTARAAIAKREAEAPPTALQGPQTPPLNVAAADVVGASPAGHRAMPVGSFVAGAATMGAALAVVRRGVVKKVGRT